MASSKKQAGYAKTLCIARILLERSSELSIRVSLSHGMHERSFPGAMRAFLPSSERPEWLLWTSC